MRNNEVYIFNTKCHYQDMDDEWEKLRDFALKDVFHLIQPGNVVVIKPNLVKECHNDNKEEWESVITNPTLLYVVLREVIRRLQGKGEIYVVDAPMAQTSWKRLMKNTGIADMIAFLRKTTTVKIFCYDLRYESEKYINGILIRKKLKGDPKGNIKIDLKRHSEFFGKKNKDYYGSEYFVREVRRFHNDVNNAYIISKTVLDADVFINMPKMKTHRFAGITASMKNLVGICTLKNSIPHRTFGHPNVGGDEDPEALDKEDTWVPYNFYWYVRRKVRMAVLRMLYLSAGISERPAYSLWHGNDTIWRSVIDLNKILLYADKNGKMKKTQQRKYITIVDGIIGGEKQGPLNVERKESGVIIIGKNPVIVETVTASVMGFDYKKIPLVNNAYGVKTYSLCGDPQSKQIVIKSNDAKWEVPIDQYTREMSLKYEPHIGWKNHIELE